MTCNSPAKYAYPFPACDEAAKARIRALGEELDAHRKRVQAQHPGPSTGSGQALSLTAMYNVLEKLRAAALWSAVAERSGDTALAGAERRGGESAPTPPAPPAHAKAASLPPHSIALTPKEQATHDAGLVSVLRQLHDELDAAVATAYGWLRDGRPETDLPDAEILTRLVALNAARAAEEAAGQIRWLRPEYQNPTGAGTLQTGLDLPATGHPKPEPRNPKLKAPWPKPPAERVAAVERALAALGKPVTAAQLAKHFLRAKPEDLAEILETLATLGRAHREGEKFTH